MEVAKWANPGVMNTKIFIKKTSNDKNPDGTRKDGYINIFGEGKYCYCKWVNAHGRDRLEAYKYGLSNLSTLTMRYSSLITSDCLIFTSDSDNINEAWQIEDVDNVENRNAWLEVFVKRKERSV